MYTDGNIITMFFKTLMKFKILAFHEPTNFYLVQGLFKEIKHGL